MALLYMSVCEVTATTATPHADSFFAPADTLGLSSPSTSATGTSTHEAALADTVRLNEVAVTATTPITTRVDRLGAITFGCDAIAKAPRVFGEADPMRFMTLLSGINTAGDYSSGVSIDGMGYAQTEYLINNIPVMFPFHFGGIFSIFAPRLYNNIRIEKSAHNPGTSNVTGGVINVNSPLNEAQQLEGEINVGLIASTIFLKAPIGKFTVAASARISYLNLLYGSLLHDDDFQAGYGFNDIDLVANGKLSPHDNLNITCHFNNDHLNFDDDTKAYDTSMRWKNILAGATWSHTSDRFTTSHTAYFSRFTNTLHMAMQDVHMAMPSSISDFGVNGKFVVEEVAPHLSIDFGYALRNSYTLPQNVSISGLGSGSYGTETESRTTAAKLWGNLNYAPHPHWRMSLGAEGAWIDTDNGYHATWLDPRLTVGYVHSTGSATLHVGKSHQWIHQVGFSEVGLASNFKIGPSASAPVERCKSITLTLSQRLNSHITLTADGYYKRIDSEPEYLGAVLDLVNTDYHVNDYIDNTTGYNVGGSVMARLEYGKLNAIASYSYCLAKRRQDTGEYYNAVGALTHTASIAPTYRFNDHWSLSAIFNLTSGRHYTPITAVYFVGEKVMMQYGQRNSATLPLYHRLDLSADYHFRSRNRLAHTINFSIINLYGHRNAEITTFVIREEENAYLRRDIGSLYKFLPSLSYTLSF
jgi:hypothetical protein